MTSRSEGSSSTIRIFIRQMYGIDFVKKLKRRNIGGSKRSPGKLFGRTVILGPTAATSTLRRRISCRNSNRTENFPQAESRSSAAGCPTFRKARKTPPMSSAARKSGSSVPRTRLAERLPGPLSSGGTARAIAVRRPVWGRTPRRRQRPTGSRNMPRHTSRTARRSHRACIRPDTFPRRTRRRP